MRLSHSLARTSAVFDDPNLVSHGGLLPVMALAQRAGLPGLRREVAETQYAAFTSKRKALHVTARLIVRRVRDKGKAAPGQGELFPA